MRGLIRRIQRHLTDEFLSREPSRRAAILLERAA